MLTRVRHPSLSTLFILGILLITAAVPPTAYAEDAGATGLELQVESVCSPHRSGCVPLEKTCAGTSPPGRSIAANLQVMRDGEPVRFAEVHVTSANQDTVLHTNDEGRVRASIQEADQVHLEASHGGDTWSHDLDLFWGAVEVSALGGLHEAPLTSGTDAPVTVTWVGSGTPPSIDPVVTVERADGDLLDIPTEHGQGTLPLDPPNAPEQATYEVASVTACGLPATDTSGVTLDWYAPNVTVDPSTVTVSADNAPTVDFTLQVLDREGNVIPHDDVPVTWTVDQEGASFDGSTLTPAYTRGTFTVGFTVGFDYPLHGNATLYVEPGAVSRITLPKDPAVQQVGDLHEVPLEVAAHDAHGNPVAIDAEEHVSWSVTPMDAGSFVGSTFVPNGLAGEHILHATYLDDPNITATANLTVLPGPVEDASVVCSDLDVATGGSTTCSARPVDAHGNVVPGIVAGWSATHGGLSSTFARTVTFTAPPDRVGNVTLTASVANATAFRNVTVEDRTAPTLSIAAPDRAQATQPAAFRVEAADLFGLREVRFLADGNLLSTRVLDDPTVANITFEPVFALKGTHTVQVRVEDPAGNVATRSLDVAVEDAPPPPAILMVSSDGVTLEGDRTRYQGTVGSDGNRPLELLGGRGALNLRVETPYEGPVTLTGTVGGALPSLDSSFTVGGPRVDASITTRDGSGVPVDAAAVTVPVDVPGDVTRVVAWRLEDGAWVQVPGEHVSVARGDVRVRTGLPASLVVGWQPGTVEGGSTTGTNEGSWDGSSTGDLDSGTSGNATTYTGGVPADEGEVTLASSDGAFTIEVTPPEGTDASMWVLRVESFPDAPNDLLDLRTSFKRFLEIDLEAPNGSVVEPESARVHVVVDREELPEDAVPERFLVLKAHGAVWVPLETVVTEDGEHVRVTAELPSFSLFAVVLDDEPPQVGLSREIPEKLRGTVTIDPVAGDNVAVERVMLRVDGETVASRTNTPASFSWNASRVDAGSHVVEVVAEDAAGNRAVSTWNVTVADPNEFTGTFDPSRLGGSAIEVTPGGEDVEGEAVPGPGVALVLLAIAGAVWRRRGA